MPRLYGRHSNALFEAWCWNKICGRGHVTLEKRGRLPLTNTDECNINPSYRGEHLVDVPLVRALEPSAISAELELKIRDF